MEPKCLHTKLRPFLKALKWSGKLRPFMQRQAYGPTARSRVYHLTAAFLALQDAYADRAKESPQSPALTLTVAAPPMSSPTYTGTLGQVQLSKHKTANPPR